MAVEYIAVFFIVFVSSVIFIGKWRAKKQPSHRHPPSLPSLPIVGSLPFLKGFDNIPKFFMEKSYELGPIFTFRAGNKLVLTLNDAEAIREALVKNSRIFSSRPEYFMQHMTNPSNKGIGFRDTSPVWKRIHKNSLGALKELGFGDKNIMEERIMKEVEELVDFGRKTEGKPFDPKELFFLVASNVAMSILFGSRQDYNLGISELISEIVHYVHLLDMMFDIVPFIKFIPPFKSKVSEMKTCHDKIHDNIQTEIDESLRSSKRCFVSEFIEREGPDYDRDEMYFVLRDFLDGGTSTTSTTMTWAMVVLANHLEIQKKLQEEIDSVISRDKYPTLQDQTKLPYVEATIHEILRWRTLVPLSMARYTNEDSVVKNFFIPAGTLVFPNLHAAHSDAKVWADQDVFRPERFLDKENNLVGLDRVITFSLGRRACPAETLARAELFLILTSFLQRFTVLPPEGQDKICDIPQMPVDILQAPKPFDIRLVDRK